MYKNIEPYNNAILPTQHYFTHPILCLEISVFLLLAATEDTWFVLEAIVEIFVLMFCMKEENALLIFLAIVGA